MTDFIKLISKYFKIRFRFYFIHDISKFTDFTRVKENFTKFKIFNVILHTRNIQLAAPTRIKFTLPNKPNYGHNLTASYFRSVFVPTPPFRPPGFRKGKTVFFDPSYCSLCKKRTPRVVSWILFCRYRSRSFYGYG
jgi:hypothetical protein